MSTAEPTEQSVLLIEDDHGDAVLVLACLAEAGVAETDVRWVRTLADGLAALFETPHECVLTDLGLPDATGLDVVAALVDAAPDVPVVVLTGGHDRHGLDVLGAGAQDYLIKDGITADGLARSIRYAAERTKAQQAQQQLFETQVQASEQARLERGLLPNPILRTDAVSCATYYRPGRDDAVLGGDFFDVIELDDGRVHAVIGDVMGHGADEAALGVHLRVAWRSLLLAGVEDSALLYNLDLLLAAEQADVSFVTVCTVVIEAGRALVRLAGHPAPIVAGATTCYPDLPVGLPLGIGRGERWTAGELTLAAGSSLVLYTDGLLEAYAGRPEADSLGIEGLVDAVRAATSTGRPAASWISTLVSGAPDLARDDTAAVVLTTRSSG